MYRLVIIGSSFRMFLRWFVGDLLLNRFWGILTRGFIDSGFNDGLVHI